MHPRQRTGRWGEEQAAQLLRASGYEVIDRNWRFSGDGVRGELDLIASRDGVLAFVEVKTRTSDRFGAAVDALDADKRRRLRRLVGAYLALRPHAGPVRGDVVTVTVRVGGAEPEVAHLRGVW